MSIRIIDLFIMMRDAIIDLAEVRLEVAAIKAKIDNHGKNIELLFQYLDELLKKAEAPQDPEVRVPIGFRLGKGKKK